MWSETSCLVVYHYFTKAVAILLVAVDKYNKICPEPQSEVTNTYFQLEYKISQINHLRFSRAKHRTSSVYKCEVISRPTRKQKTPAFMTILCLFSLKLIYWLSNDICPSFSAPQYSLTSAMAHCQS